MRIVGVVPGAKLFGSEDLYADHYLFVNGYPSASPPAAARRSHPQQRRLCHSGGAHALRLVRLLRRRALLSLSFSGHGIRGQIRQARGSGICLGMQMMNTYFLVAEEAVRRGWDGPLLALFDQMKKERYMFTEPVDGHWNGHITRDAVDSFKHPIHVVPDSRLARLTGRETILGASMHNYRSRTRLRPSPSPAARTTARSRRWSSAIRCSASSSTPRPTTRTTPCFKLFYEAETPVDVLREDRRGCCSLNTMDHCRVPKTSS